jgi:hypothetical protein
MATEHCNLAGGAAKDSLRAAVVARRVDRMRLTGQHLNPVRLDKHVDHERAAGLPLAVQTVAAIDEERLCR